MKAMPEHALPGDNKELYVDMEYSDGYPFVVVDCQWDKIIRFTLEEAVALAARITKAVEESKATNG